MHDHWMNHFSLITEICPFLHDLFLYNHSPDNYNIKQAEEIAYNNITFDDNIAVGNDYGQW